jgi:hypothetical protein
MINYGTEVTQSVKWLVTISTKQTGSGVLNFLPNERRAHFYRRQRCRSVCLCNIMTS